MIFVVKYQFIPLKIVLGKHFARIAVQRFIDTLIAMIMPMFIISCFSKNLHAMRKTKLDYDMSFSQDDETDKLFRDSMLATLADRFDSTQFKEYQKEVRMLSILMSS